MWTSPHGEELRLLTNCQPQLANPGSEQPWKTIVPYQLSFKMTKAPASILVANSWEPRRQNHPVKSFLRFSFTEALGMFVRQHYYCITDTRPQFNVMLVFIFKILRPHPWY